MRESKKLIWSVLLPAMLLPLLGSWLYFVLFSKYPAARFIYLATKGFTVIWPIAAVRLILKRPFFKDLPDLKTNLKALPAGIISGLFIVALMFSLLQTPFISVVTGASEPIRSKVIDLGVLNYYWTFAFFLAFVHSLIEEIYWRWFVFGYLSRVLPLTAAHLLAGISFAAHHVVIATQYFPFWWGAALGGSVGIGGVIWSIMYRRQHTLAGAWVSHIIADLGILWIGWILISL